MSSVISETNVNLAPAGGESVVELVQSLMERAVRQRASDIHFELVKSGVRIRFRVDGRLKTVMYCETSIYSMLAARLKVLCGMDVSEKRKPQDGRCTFQAEQTEVDVRVSSLPTICGETLVMRFFYQEIWKKEFGELGLAGEELQRFKKMIERPNGLILVTGPTGSGKSTTLYAALWELNQEHVNIVTVEEPVEVRLDGVNQIPANLRAGLTFASALRSLLRQDPDIIMVGEVRDSETAAIVVRASLTGRLVFSTLHTINASKGVIRLLDLGVEPYLAADVLSGIVAQRLVRRLCGCRKSREADEKEKAALGLKPEKIANIWEPCGCEQCGGSGYQGRTGVFEVMRISPALQAAIRTRQPASVLQELAVKEGMKTLRENTARLVLDGVTSMEEFHRIIGEEV